MGQFVYFLFEMRYYVLYGFYIGYIFIILSIDIFNFLGFFFIRRHVIKTVKTIETLT